MKTSQAGIFALGTGSHTYLEFDLIDTQSGDKLVTAISSMREPRTTIGGVNLVVGFRPELWNQVAADHAPSGVRGFNKNIVGKDGFIMPASQHDAVLWLSGSAYDVLFDVAHAAIATVKDLASVAEETSSWAYKHDRDLTGFIDGSENPSLIDAPDAALIADGSSADGGTVLLLQKWKHDTSAWECLSVHQQEQIMGRKNSTVSNLLISRQTRTSPAPIRIDSAKSSAATCPMELSQIMEQCSSASAPSNSVFLQC